jgi:hypothetical protein
MAVDVETVWPVKVVVVVVLLVVMDKKDVQNELAVVPTALLFKIEMTGATRAQDPVVIGVARADGEAARSRARCQCMEIILA